MKVYIEQGSVYYNYVYYVLRLIEVNKGVEFTFLDAPEGADLKWSFPQLDAEKICLEYYQSIENKTFKSENWFSEKTEILTSEGDKDVMATIFHMVNCMQEFEAPKSKRDKIGRYLYTESYQYKFGNVTENLVQEEIDAFCKAHNIVGKPYKSVFFISHDIDHLYSSKYEDVMWAVKNKKIGVLLYLIMNEIARKPHWRNIDRVIKINSEYDVISTFFWLVNKGTGKDGVVNAEYEISQEKSLLQLVLSNKFVNGLHKSSSDESINEELRKGLGYFQAYNRYHYLKYYPHEDWSKIEESALDFDCSLGFAEHYGFRNSYGRSFQPFDLEGKKPFGFLQAGTTFMDTTMDKYMKMPSERIGDTIIDFYEQHKEQADIALLWHNRYISDFKYGEFLPEYKKVLSYLYERKIETVTPEDLIERNKLKC